MDHNMPARLYIWRKLQEHGFGRWVKECPDDWATCWEWVKLVNGRMEYDR